jgi:signal peptidase I
MNNSKIKNILNIGMKVISWLLIAFTAFMMIFTIITVTTVDKNERKFLGVKLYIVRTDSMSLSENNKDMDVHFNAGDIVIIGDVKDPTSLQPGDIISFISTNQVSYGETVTHMIREVRKTASGKVEGYVTFGTNTGTNDESLVEPEYVLGIYKGKLPGVGHFFAYVKSTPGYIVCILIPFLLLILYNGYNVIRLFRQYKKEQSEALEAERAEIAAERREAEQMLRELQALKEQLSMKTGDGASPTAESTKETAEEPAPAQNEEAEVTVNETEPASNNPREN